MKYRFTVFTASYNRAHTLPRVYQSLKRQTLRDFEWLIIDDGSVDNTRQLVQAWCAEADFPIRYIWQEHAHKKVAFNRGVREACGELFLNLDSDDEALPEALDTFNQVWRDIPKNDRHRYSAVTALCVDPAGNIVGSRFPADILDSNSIETALRYRIRGEKWGFQRVDVLREFPFPEDVVGLVPEAVVWYRIAQKYLTRYVNVALRVYHPGEDSLTAGLSDSHMRSDGRALLAREILEHHWRWGVVNPLAILKEAVAYTCFSMHLASSQGGKRWPLKGVVAHLLVTLMWPVGFVRYHVDNRRSGRRWGCTIKRRRVLFVIPTLRGGGAERVMMTLLCHLNRERFQLALAVVDSREAEYRANVPKDVEFIELRCTRVRYALPKIVRLIWRKRPDVVFATLGHLNLALAMLRPLLPNGVRCIGRESCVVSQTLTEYTHPRLWAWAYRRFYGRFDVVVCQSLDMRDDLVGHFAFPPVKAVVIHNPVDIERIRCLAAEVNSRDHEPPAWRSETAPYLVAAGRLSRQKGFDLLIEALALCDDTRPWLTLLGEGPLRPALEQLARQRGVADRVRFAGFRKNPYPFFVRADAFVLSSRYEGFPNVVLEALACGTSVIAMPCLGGVAEVTEVAGGVLLASAVDAESLGVAIKRFLAGETRARRITLTSFHVDKIVEQYEALLIDEALPQAAVHER